MAPSTFTTTNEVPETMHFDVPRFSEWSTEFKAICKLATVIIMVGQFFSDKKAKEEKKNAEAMEQDNMDVSTTQYKTYDEIKAQILDDENSFPFNTEGWDPVLCKSMASLESDEQPVYVLIKTRILNVVYKLISGKSVGNLGAFGEDDSNYGEGQDDQHGDRKGALRRLHRGGLRQEASGCLNKKMSRVLWPNAGRNKFRLKKMSP
jgi:hypothetical protein